MAQHDDVLVRGLRMYAQLMTLPFLTCPSPIDKKRHIYLIDLLVTAMTVLLENQRLRLTGNGRGSNRTRAREHRCWHRHAFRGLGNVSSSLQDILISIFECNNTSPGEQGLSWSGHLFIYFVVLSVIS